MTSQEARERIKQAIDKRGGVRAFADQCGVHFTTIYDFFKGSRPDEENVSKMRTALGKDVPVYVWADVLGPMLAEDAR